MMAARHRMCCGTQAQQRSEQAVSRALLWRWQRVLAGVLDTLRHNALQACPVDVRRKRTLCGRASESFHRMMQAANRWNERSGGIDKCYINGCSGLCPFCVARQADVMSSQDPTF